jgi:hypothetical protein
MKSKAISVLILSISFILVSLILVSSYVLSKPKQTSEWITFYGDLEGAQEVVGCCPNAGPYPEYTMTLSEVFPTPMPGTYDGNIFMNVFGRGKKKSYIVQFSWTDGSDYFIEIIGGDIEWNKKEKSLTVTFDKVPCEIWIDGEYTETKPVDFILTREEL